MKNNLNKPWDIKDLEPWIVDEDKKEVLKTTSNKEKPEEIPENNLDAWIDDKSCLEPEIKRVLQKII